MNTESHGPALTLAEIENLAPHLPAEMQRALHLQRADAYRVHRTAANYHTRLLHETKRLQNNKRAVEDRQFRNEGA